MYVLTWKFQLIQAVRRLYKPKGKKIPITLVVEINRRLMEGYNRYRDDPRIINLKKAVLSYNRELVQLQIRDHQVETVTLPFRTAIGLLISRVAKLLALSILVIPGAVLFAPIFAIGKYYSNIKSREALAASTVKVQGWDVIATWKLLVSLAAAPAFYVSYTIISTIWYVNSNCSGYVPDMPTGLFSFIAFCLLVSASYAALRFGEIGMDIAKSLRPLAVALSPFHGRMLLKLRQRRQLLAGQVMELINTLGPEVFPDFDSHRIVREDGSAGFESGSAPSEPPSPTWPEVLGYRAAAQQLPRNESLRDISNVGLFPSRPHTPHHPRSRSLSGSYALGGKGLGMTPLDSQEGIAEVHRRIQLGMRERVRRRKSETEFESGASTPGSEFDGLSMTMGKKDS
jgi:glycerol-3-phosphate O-acyltransferase/dihydroxyacetone phosphate acyltransferase